MLQEVPASTPVPCHLVARSIHQLLHKTYPIPVHSSPLPDAHFVVRASHRDGQDVEAFNDGPDPCRLCPDEPWHPWSERKGQHRYCVSHCETWPPEPAL